MENLMMSKCDYYFGIGGDCVPYNSHYCLYENECARKQINYYADDDYYNAKNYNQYEDCDNDNDCDLMRDDYEREYAGDCFESDNKNIWMSVTFSQLLEMGFEDVADKIFSGEIQ